ncbi:MAG: hypothetical protein JST87_15560 [Bacteroidetes bacterium]|nr:hypothetical protein [Bacteroidota bacterium]
MKKLKLKALELGVTEVLTREQLKNVLGGDSGSGGSGGTYGLGFCSFFGTCGTWPVIMYNSDNPDAANQAQNHADSVCMILGTCCTDVDCPGAD